MQIPDEYKTGNPGMDEKIVKALEKEKRQSNVNALNKLSHQLFGDNKRTNKYNVADKEDRTYTDGTLFASKKEMERWHYLKMLERSGEIRNLRGQVPFILQESFINRQWGDIRPITYVADFVYINVSFRKGLEEREIVEDSKGGILTSVYKLKKKLFLYKYGDRLFFEV